MREEWVEANLIDLISDRGIFSDGDWVESKDQDPNGTVRLIQLADIGDGIFVNKSNRFLTSKKANELNCTFLKQGDILIARMPNPLGRAAIFPFTEEDSFITVVDVAIIRFENKQTVNKFFLYNINSPYSRRKIEALQSGTTRKRISRKNLSKISFPLAPLPEQRAIVAKIEQLFSELDNGIANLKAAKEKLEIYRQAVLKKAFEGELTKDWRENNQDKTNIQIEEAYSYRNSSISMPDRWKWVKLNEISVAIGGYAFQSKDFNKTAGKYQVLRIGNIRPGIIRFNEAPVFLDEVEEKVLFKSQLFPKDVLITLTGTRKKRDYGYTAIVKNSNLLLNQRVAALRFNKNFIPEFFLYYSWTNGFKDQFFGSETGNVGQGNVGMNSIRNTGVPLPSIQEQAQIVQEIETRLSLCDNILINIDEGLIKAEALRQSILKKAFEGRLLNEAELETCRREPDWEPAEKLLERINKLKKEDA